MWRRMRIRNPWLAPEQVSMPAWAQHLEPVRSREPGMVSSPVPGKEEEQAGSAARLEEPFRKALCTGSAAKLEEPFRKALCTGGNSSRAVLPGRIWPA